MAVFGRRRRRRRKVGKGGVLRLEHTADEDGSAGAAGVAAVGDVVRVVPPELGVGRVVGNGGDHAVGGDAGGGGGVGLEQVVDGEQAAVADDAADVGGLVDVGEGIAAQHRQIGIHPRGDAAEGFAEQLAGVAGGGQQGLVGAQTEANHGSKVHVGADGGVVDGRVGAS